VVQADVKVDFRIAGPGPFQIFGPDPAPADLVVIAPEFLQVKKTVVEPYDAKGTERVKCLIYLEARTGRVGEFHGFVKVRLGKNRARFPASLTVRPQGRGLTKVLITGTPFHSASTHEGSMFEPFLDAVRDSSADVDYARTLPSDLSKYQVVFLSGRPLALASVEGRQADLHRFVQSGGRLVLWADRNFSGSVDEANQILAGHGLEMINIEVSGWLDVAGISVDPLTAGIRHLRFPSPSPVRVTDPTKSKILALDPINIGRGPVGVYRNKGEIVAVGEGLLWHWVQQDEGRSDLSGFLKNLLSVTAEP